MSCPVLHTGTTSQQGLIVNVVEALLKVEIAQRVLLNVPNVQIAVGLVVALQDRHGDLVAVTADAQVLDGVEVGQLLPQVHEAPDGLGLAPTQIEHFDNALGCADRDIGAVHGGQERIALVLSELEHLFDSALERSDVHLGRVLVGHGN